MTATNIDLDGITAKAWFERLVESGASDLHLRVGSKPAFRVDGHLARGEELCDVSLEEFSEFFDRYGCLDKITQATAGQEVDLAIQISGIGRFRVNVFRQQNTLCGAFRLIPAVVPDLDSLGLPGCVQELVTARSGLVLVTGPTGSGKSTTLASIVNQINSSRAAHIVTVEDPIEFVHTDIRSSVIQREIGEDTHSFSNALRQVVRQDPDVIMVGELRDLDSISHAVTAAETGHLVLATLHTVDAVQTVDRMIDVFPAAQQTQLRLQVANSLKAILSQTLVKKASGQGQVAAVEVLLCDSGESALIREGRTHLLRSSIQSGARRGMLSMDESLRRLVAAGEITIDSAMGKSSNPDEFRDLVRRNIGVEPVRESA